MRLFALLSLVVFPIVAHADPFEELQGAWNGSGSAREAVESPEEAIRCRLENAYNQERLELSVTGACIASGQRLTLAGTLRKDANSEAVSGNWNNPNGIGDVRVAGRYGDDFIVFAVRATDPATGEKIAQNVEWRLVGEELRLRSIDHDNPGVTLSQVVFKR